MYGHARKTVDYIFFFINLLTMFSHITLTLRVDVCQQMLQKGCVMIARQTEDTQQTVKEQVHP